MPSGLKSGGTDLDSLFKARSGGDPSAGATGLKASGTDIAGRYYPSAGAHDRRGANVSLKAAGADLKTIFRDIAYDGPTITAQPANATQHAGGSVTFTVTATGTATITYQWRKNGANIGGATGASYTINPVATADAASYDCVVTNSYCSVTSTAATLHVSPGVTVQPADITEDSGTGPYALQVTAAGEATLQFQWFKDGVSLHAPRNGNVSGTQDQHVINPGDSADNGSYFCRVTNTYGTQDSDAATVTFTDIPPTVTTDPAGFSAPDGTGPYALQCYATQGSGATLRFEWFKDGVSFLGPRVGNLSGGLGDQHVFNPIAYADAADYYCRVTTTHGNDTSATATVTVT
jgi:hypothetical protein